MVGKEALKIDKSRKNALYDIDQNIDLTVHQNLQPWSIFRMEKIYLALKKKGLHKYLPSVLTFTRNLFSEYFVRY